MIIRILFRYGFSSIYGTTRDKDFRFIFVNEMDIHSYYKYFQNVSKYSIGNSKILYALWMFVNKYFITWQKLSFLIDHIGYAVCLLRCFICLYFDVNKFEKKRLRSHLWLFTTEFKFKLWLLKAIRPVRTNNKLVLYSIWMPLLIIQQFVQFANT